MQPSRTFSSMLDFSFNHFISATLIRLVYGVLVVVVLLLAALAILTIWAGSLSQGFVNFMISLPLAPIGVGIVALLNLFFLRIFCEGLILLFRIAENLRSIDRKLPEPQLAGERDGA